MNYVRLLKNFADGNIYETLLGVTKKSIGGKLDQSRMILREPEIKKLGGTWASLTKGLKHPSITVGTNARANSSVTGVVVSDSTRGTVKKYALQIEEKKGGSIFQLKEQTLNSEGKMETTCDRLVDTSDPMLQMFIKSENQTRSPGMERVLRTPKKPSGINQSEGTINKPNVKREMAETTAPKLKQEKMEQKITQAPKTKAVKKEEIAASAVKDQSKIIEKPVLKFEPIENLTPEQIEDEIKVLGERLKKQEKELWNEVFPSKQFDKKEFSDDFFPSRSDKQFNLYLKDLYECSVKNHYHPYTGNAVKVNNKMLQLRQECLDIRNRLYQLSLYRTQNPNFKLSKNDVQKFIDDYSKYDVSNFSSRIQHIVELPSKNKRIDAAVQMFAEDIKIPAEHIIVKKYPYKQGSPVGAAFKPEEGIIYTYFPSSMSPTTQIAMLRHEMDHLEVFAKMCKSMGMEDFIQMLKKKNPNLDEKLVRKRYAKLIETVDIKDFDTEKYIKAFQDYDMGMMNLSPRNYIGNPIESRAYRLQAQYDYNNPLSRSNAITTNIYTEVNEMLDAISKEIGKEFSVADLNSLIGNKLLREVADPTGPYIGVEMAHNATKLLEEILKNLRNGVSIENTVELFKHGITL